MLSILSGTLIHTQLNQQSIYRIKINDGIVNISYIQLSTILILSISKEEIINSLNFCISSLFIFLLSLLGSLFTTLHTMKIWVYCFNYLLCSYSSSQSTLLVLLVLLSLLMDECLEYCFILSSFTVSDYESILGYSVGTCCFSIVGWIGCWLLLVVVGVVVVDVVVGVVVDVGVGVGVGADAVAGGAHLRRSPQRLRQDQRRSHPLHLFTLLHLHSHHSFSSFQTFYLPFFMDTLLLFSSYFFKGPIYWIEMFIGNNNINWYYCHYFSNIQFISFSLMLSILFIVG